MRPCSGNNRERCRKIHSLCGRARDDGNFATSLWGTEMRREISRLSRGGGCAESLNAMSRFRPPEQPRLGKMATLYFKLTSHPSKSFDIGISCFLLALIPGQLDHGISRRNLRSNGDSSLQTKRRIRRARCEFGGQKTWFGSVR